MPEKQLIHYAPPGPVSTRFHAMCVALYTLLLLKAFQGLWGASTPCRPKMDQQSVERQATAIGEMP
jgi:hypothetical protein